MKIQILGTESPLLQELAHNAQTALTASGCAASLETITDPAQIQAMGASITPALAIDGVVRSSGRLLSAEEIATHLQNAANAPVNAATQSCGCSAPARTPASSGCGCGCSGSSGYFRMTAMILAALLIVGIFISTREEPSSGVKLPLSTEFKPVVSNSQGMALPRLVEFGSAFCPPCVQMAPVLLGLQKSHSNKLAVEYYDVDSPSGKKIALSKQIEATPTLIFYAANGKELFRHSGILTRDEILKRWSDLGVTF